MVRIMIIIILAIIKRTIKNGIWKVKEKQKRRKNVKQ